MDQEHSYCADHGLCMERISQHSKSISQMNEEISRLKEKVNDIRLEQIQDREQIKGLYIAINEIKDSLKLIAQELKKPDFFRDTVAKFGIEVIKMGIIGGIIMYFIKLGIK